MPLDRRRLLLSAPPFLLASAIPLSGAHAASRKLAPALLVPRSGDLATLGLAMERGATLAQASAEGKGLMVFDTAGDGGAAGAAREAMRRGADLILGPLFSAEVRPVLAEVRGRAPVLTFSNDAALRESGAFLLGITARQTVAQIVEFAAGRGVRRIAVAAGEDAWGLQVRTAAADAAPPAGLAVSIVPEAAFAGGVGGVGGGDPAALPDAALYAAPAALAAAMPALADAGIQPLGAFGALDLDPAALDRLQGAWLATPDPQGFSAFAERFEQRMGSRPGLIAGLAHDGGAIAAVLARGGSMDRAALLAATGFAGVCGTLRFREDGSALRRMAVLEVLPGQVRSIMPDA